MASIILERIEALGKNTSNDEWSISKTLVRSLLGRYYRAIGDLDQARKIRRPGVEVGLKLLSDEYEENGYSDFVRLGETLLDYGDGESATLPHGR